MEWEVLPTTIEDEYQIVLSAAYQTDVPAGRRLRMEYNAIGDMTVMILGESTVTDYSYNSKGLVANIVKPGGFINS